MSLWTTTTNWLKKIKNGPKAYDLLLQVHTDNLNNFLYSGKTREDVAAFFGLPVICWNTTCTREDGHDGPCNGYPCHSVYEKCLGNDGYFCGNCGCVDIDKSNKGPIPTI